MFIRFPAIALLIGAAVVPTGRASDVLNCNNDEDWRIKIGRDRPGGPWVKGCDWVARKRWKRCRKNGQDPKYRFAQDACPGACNAICVFQCIEADDKDWFFLPKKYEKRGVVGNKHRDCKWAARHGKCFREGISGEGKREPAFKACCESCNDELGNLRGKAYSSPNSGTDGLWLNYKG